MERGDDHPKLARGLAWQHDSQPLVQYVEVMTREDLGG
jgi:hypothetical protein